MFEFSEDSKLYLMNAGPIDQQIDSPSQYRQHTSGPTDETDPTLVLRVRGTSVLLVEDSADNRALIARYLHHSGAEVDFAENGVEGIKQALASRYDVVLMDIQMPRLNGLEAVRKLRDYGYEGSVVAVTGQAQKAERNECLEAGFDEYLTKPVHRLRLLYTIACQPVRERADKRPAVLH